ncbi:MAG: NAD(P)/FAD-dependent oxidoreductase [Cyclobacteriaceae bacterium]|nr:NAD(P)/FAD-dependent oxidoreductase [Cyclobacteriaceae bacterium]
MKEFDLIVIGGGAAGFFGAINAAITNPNLSILILEKTNKLLSKVRVSGGGRCNVTHHCFEPTPLSKHYPRGQQELKKLFRFFQAKDVVAWFDQRGVKLKTEEDGRMFPITNQSETIIDCFLSEAYRLNIKIEKNAEVINVKSENTGFSVLDSNQRKYQSKKILIANGGMPKRSAYQWIVELGHSLVDPIPSLFTFNDSLKKFKDLMGVSVENATVQIAGTKFKESGPVLITHWGLSGPAVIKLSSWAAEYLFQKNYEFVALVNWTGQYSEDDVRDSLNTYRLEHPKQKIVGHALYGLPNRLWVRLCLLSEIDELKIWGEIPKKNLNRLIENLVRCEFRIKGKTTFKEEFVTCGGVSLNEINLNTMESKIVPGVYFAGEVLDIDGETGGFNFQSAWTTAFVAARAITL